MTPLEIFSIFILSSVFIVVLFFVFKKKLKTNQERIKQHILEIQKNISSKPEKQKTDFEKRKEWGEKVRKPIKVERRIGGAGGKGIESIIENLNNKRHKSSHYTKQSNYTADDNSALLRLTDAQRMVVLSDPLYSIHHNNHHDYQVEDSNGSIRHPYVRHESTITNDTSPTYDPPSEPPSYDSGGSYDSGSSSFSSD